VTSSGSDSLEAQKKYPWLLYDSVVHQGYLFKFCDLFCGHSSSSQEFDTVGINLGTVWSLFYYWTSKLINLLLLNRSQNLNKYPWCTTLSYNSHGYFCSFFVELNTLASDTKTSGVQLSGSERWSVCDLGPRYKWVGKSLWIKSLITLSVDNGAMYKGAKLGSESHWIVCSQIYIFRYISESRQSKNFLKFQIYI
jgi:hypothetical protein